jgi:hypothetical protein
MSCRAWFVVCADERAWSGLVLMQETAQHAFQFCLKYQRKTEFRRLCDLLRQHLQNVQKYGNQANSINLNNPEYVAALM